MIEQAEALGEAPEDPLLLFSVLYAFWVANHMAFNGDVCRDLAAQFLALAEKQRATVPLMVGHRIMGISLLVTGDITVKRHPIGTPANRLFHEQYQGLRPHRGWGPNWVLKHSSHIGTACG